MRGEDARLPDRLEEDCARDVIERVVEQTRVVLIDEHVDIEAAGCCGDVAEYRVAVDPAAKCFRGMHAADGPWTATGQWRDPGAVLVEAESGSTLAPHTGPDVAGHPLDGHRDGCRNGPPEKALHLEGDADDFVSADLLLHNDGAELTVARRRGSQCGNASALPGIGGPCPVESMYVNIDGCRIRTCFSCQAAA